MFRILAGSLLPLVAVVTAYAQNAAPCNCDCPPSVAWKKISPLQVDGFGKVVGGVFFDGNALPGATVTLTNGPREFTQITDASGRFEFFNISPGEYRLRSDLIGLKSRTKKQVAVVANNEVSVDVEMRIGPSEMICVDCGNVLPLLPDGPHFVITREMLDNLPLH